MGFGHRVYKNYDPRAKIIKQVADEVFEVTGRNPLLDIALELEQIALEDEYFVEPEALPERRLLLGDHLPGARAARGDVPGDVRDPANRRLARPVARRDSTIRSRRSPARASSTSARTSGRTCRSTRGSRSCRRRTSWATGRRCIQTDAVKPQSPAEVTHSQDRRRYSGWFQWRRGGPINHDGPSRFLRELGLA